MNDENKDKKNDNQPQISPMSAGSREAPYFGAPQEIPSAVLEAPEPNISEELRDAGVRTVTDQISIDPQTGAIPSGPDLAHPIEPSGIVGLNQADLTRANKEVKNRPWWQSILWKWSEIKRQLLRKKRMQVKGEMS